ncbi:hypothetical protein EKN51_11355 [Enterobacter hormaechei]|uniref:hypothetical protein n=1 Tax=Enterobacter hormaechei TaxID=158836 RepID=UPI000F826873|nr:hypothetical protein [Enterobacter hormaechei]RTP15614.1 hypothetical protein EKN51_11355 [Enterobacter hormaechei]
MKHYVYRTTVTTLGESFYYFGKHTSKKDNDGYMGSGTMIKSTLKHLDYLKQHDPDFMIENEILCYFETDVDALEFEELLVEEAKSKFGCMCMNVAEGGLGDCNAYMNEYEKRERARKISKGLTGIKRSRETKKKMSESMKNISYETRQKMINALRLKTENNPPWKRPRAVNSVDSQILWSLSGLIYDVWIETNMKHVRLKSECIRRGIPISEKCQLGKMVNWFEKGNNPHDFDLPK